MIVLRDTRDAEVRMLVRELNGIEVVMRRRLSTRGGLTIDKGARVTLSASGRTVWIEAPKCDHCGVRFQCRISTKELPDYVCIPVPSSS